MPTGANTLLPGPTSFRFDVRGYLDDAPMSGVQVSARAVLIAKQKTHLERVEGDVDNVVEVILGNHICETKSAATGADGSVTLLWDPRSDPAFKAGWDQFRSNDVKPMAYIDAGYTLSASAAPTLFRLRDPIPVGDWQRRQLRLDLAAAIVGHVTDTTARLWFAPAGQVLAAGLGVRCIVSRPGGRRTLPRAHPLTFSGVGPTRTDHPHALLDLRRLTPDTRYEYLLVVDNGSVEWIAARGSFRTTDPTAAQVRLAFASCNEPRTTDDLKGWAAIRGWSPDALILMGDQIYGDPIDGGKPERVWSAQSWPAYYDRLYRNQWRHREIRDVLSGTPTYMMHDDHDIVDDWGTTFTTLDANVQGRVRAAQTAFDIYQHSHNPPLTHRTTTDDTYDYSLRRGPVAIYVLDERTRRGIETTDKVLGAAQWARLRTWAASPEVATADVIVLVSPVPLALCDTKVAEVAIKGLNAAATAVGYAQGGWDPWTDLIYASAEEVLGFSVHAHDHRVETTYHEGRMVEPDMADQWTHPDNIAELGRLVELLFALQNDPARQRAVVVLAGDSHVAATYTLRQFPPKAGNNLIYQIISSPLATPPDSQLAKVLPLLGGFAIAPGYHPATHSAELGDVWAKRNFGSLVVERQPGPSRRYEVRAALHFPNDGTEARLDLQYDLDRPGPPVPLVPRPVPVVTVDRRAVPPSALAGLLPPSAVTP